MHASHQTSDLLEFLENWRELYDTLKNFDKDKTVTKEEEEKFLDLKSRIARHQAAISVTYGFDNHFTDRVMAVINQVVSLKDYVALSPAQIKKLDTDWHHLFILMNGQIGMFSADMQAQEKVGFVKNLIKNPFVILIILVGLIVGGFFFSQKFLSKETTTGKDMIEEADYYE